MEVVASLLFLVFLLGEAFFAAAEIALISVGEAWLHKHARKNFGARVALILLRDPERLLATTLLGLNLCVIANGVFTTGFLLEMFPRYGALMALLGLPPVMLLFGQIIPKNLARDKAETLAPILAPPLYLVSRILFPLTFVVSKLIKKTLESLRLSRDPRPSILREELKGLVVYGEGLEPMEKAALARLFEFSGKTVGQVMVPLIRVKVLPERARVEEALRLLAHYGFSRLPVFRERVYHLIGVVRAHDLLEAPKDSLLSAYVQKVPYIPEFKPAAETLSEMQKSGEDFAVVVDEYGAAVGIVTMEDLVEEILGDFWDELEMELKPCIKLDSGHFLVKAFMEIEKAREIGIELPPGEYETVGGFVLKMAGRIPKTGEKFRYKDWEIRVKKATPMGIEELEFVKIS